MTSTMLVSATVVNFCNISAAPRAFLSYNITTLCTPGVSATLSMNVGNNTGAPHTLIWSDGSIETVTTVGSHDPVVVTIRF